ncbi:hypothetical protein ACHHYP_00266 [Achlya hypogyna]|uniref:Protein DPCD n=1 Tax=Achlya hypogyna TaxID=1202772 RepID=A0A1V9ZUR2_ACHHY|nr:hypothetical protein ACHHYP_00266 [Achlya hypogyna]
MFQNHSGGKSTLVAAGGRKRVHTTFADGVEMIEEYTKDGSPQLLARRWKAPTALGGDGKWEFEIGEPATDDTRGRDIGLAPSCTTPVFLCRESPTCWEWRVRNLPYPKDTYAISVDDDSQTITIRTSNKKYFKRFQVPALVRGGHRLDAQALSFDHANSTLVVQYAKPLDVVELERKTMAELLRGTETSEPQCRQQ